MPAHIVQLRDSDRDVAEVIDVLCEAFFDYPVMRVILGPDNSRYEAEIGARRSAQGRGLGRALLDHVHALSRADTASEGVSLNTENPRNVTLYQHVGYSVVGHAVVSAELQTWGFYRPDSQGRV